MLLIPSKIQPTGIKNLLKNTYIRKPDGNLTSGGRVAWSIARGLGPRPEGVRGFKSHPPHLSGKINHCEELPSRTLSEVQRRFLSVSTYGYRDQLMRYVFQSLDFPSRAVCCFEIVCRRLRSASRQSQFSKKLKH